MSENFDDLLHPHYTSIHPKTTDTPTLLIPTTTKAVAHSPTRPLSFEFDDPLKNPFADLPSSTTTKAEVYDNYGFSEEGTHLQSTTSHPPTDPASLHFESLSLSTTQLPIQTSSTLSPPNDSATPHHSAISQIASTHTPITPIENSAILFPPPKPAPTFLMQETITLKHEVSAGFHDPLLNPPSPKHQPPSSPRLPPTSTPVPHAKWELLKDVSAHPVKKDTQQPVPADPAVPTSFFLSVTDPIKVSDPLSPFVVYKVTSKKLADSQPQVYVVSRRYSEFLWLFNQLVNAYPGVIVPSLPEKQAVGRFQDDFIEHRRIGLSNFLVKVAHHPILKKDPQFITFLQSESTNYKSSDKSQVILSKTKANETDKYFETKLHETEVLESLFKALLKSFETVALKHQELGNVHAEYGELMHMFAEVEEPHPLYHRIQHLGDVHHQLKKWHEEMVSVELFNHTIAIEGQLRTLHSTKLAFQSRATKLQALQSLDAFMQKKRASLAKSNVSQPFVVEELEKLSVSVQAANKSFEDATNVLRQELDRVNEERYHEISMSIQTLFESMAYKQQMLVHLWEDFYKLLTTHH